MYARYPTQTEFDHQQQQIKQAQQQKEAQKRMFFQKEELGRKMARQKIKPYEIDFDHFNCIFKGEPTIVLEMFGPPDQNLETEFNHKQIYYTWFGSGIHRYIILKRDKHKIDFRKYPNVKI